MGKDNLGDRMKLYEQAEAGRRLTPLLPICVRLDGKNFSNLTRDLDRPFDRRLHNAMQYTTRRLVEESGAVIGYTQSDEISLILYKDKTDSQVFFDGKIQKLVSVLASMATLFFREAVCIALSKLANSPAFFDCRVWNVPTKEEAINALIWRELDATKNSVSMAARHYFTHKQLHGKTCSEMQEMLFSVGVNWNDYPPTFKRGSYLKRISVSEKFSPEEIELLPEKHQARQNPDLVIARSFVDRVELPPICKIKNRVDFFFNGKEAEV